MSCVHHGKQRPRMSYHALSVVDCACSAVGHEAELASLVVETLRLRLLLRQTHRCNLHSTAQQSLLEAGRDIQDITYSIVHSATVQYNFVVEPLGLRRLLRQTPPVQQGQPQGQTTQPSAAYLTSFQSNTAQAQGLLLKLTHRRNLRDRYREQERTHHGDNQGAKQGVKYSTVSCTV